MQQGGRAAFKDGDSRSEGKQLSQLYTFHAASEEQPPPTLGQQQQHGSLQLRIVAFLDTTDGGVPFCPLTQL